MQYTPLILNNASVVLNTSSGGSSDDISDHVQEVRIARKFDLHDDSRMGQLSRSRIQGLDEWTASITLIQDFSAGLDDILANLLPVAGSSKRTTLRIRPNNAIQSSGNPTFTGVAVLEQYEPMAGRIGDLLTTTIPFQSGGTLTRTTSSTSSSST
jgi:hypothetical protein